MKAYFEGSAISASALSSLSSGSASKALKSAATKNQLEWGTLAATAVPKGLSIEGVIKGKTTRCQLQPVVDQRASEWNLVRR